MTDLTLVVVGADLATLRTFDLSHVDAAEVVLVANERGESLAAIGNRYLDASRSAIFGLVHADCIFGPGSLPAFAAAARKGVAGIVGITDLNLYRWCFDKPGTVQTLDSCSVFFARDSGLRFDAVAFDGFHCHIQDLCMQAHERGMPVMVPAADASHVGWNFDKKEWRADYEIYKSRLHAKWSTYGEIKTT